MEIELGYKLKQLRKEHELSQEELAQKLHISRQTVYKWESNKCYPDIQNISDILQ